MARVLFISQRIGSVSLPSGGGAHLAATLAGLEASFTVEAVTAQGDGHSVGERARRLRLLVPERVRGLRRDLLLMADDRAFTRRALAVAEAFEPDVVYERSEYFSLAGLRVSRALRVPLVLEVNGLHDRDARTMYRSLAEPVGAWLERRKLRRADAVVTVSAGLAKRLRAECAGAAPITVVPNSVDPDLVCAGPRPVAPESANLGFIGHLMPWYRDGLAVVLDALPEVGEAVQELRFTVVGDGPGLDELEARAEALGLSGNVQFTGAVSRDEAPQQAAAFDVGIVPPLFDYAFPVKLVELGAAGVPVVAPQSAALDEMLEPGVEYEPYDPKDPASLREALVRVLGDPDRRRRLGAALHDAVRRRFTWDATARQLHGVVASVLTQCQADGLEELRHAEVVRPAGDRAG